ncbi:hypothetical protein RB195_020671 [Necator americanus]
MTRTCPHCGSSDIDEDAGRGDATCMACGTVLEESIVVSENQFQERAGGSGHTLVGQFVSIERAQSQARAGGVVSQESREVTFAKGRKLIEEIASQLRINQHCIDTAYNFFKMSVSRNLTRGRIRSHVVVACLYMTCRLENTAHLLLDFSDITQVNVFDLGRTLSFLSRSLRINLPSTDPCLYIMRFACLLEFGEKQKEVVNLATRLVQRMKRDWMSTGRRPTGLCGAALLLAARSFNFNRTIGDVVKVVHISESVVRKRLEEFSQTPSGALTIDEFSTIDLEHCEDPPAFREARRKAREEQLAKEAELAAEMEKDVLPIEEELERALEKKRREKFKQTRYAKLVAGELNDPEVGTAEEALVRDEVMDTVYQAVDEEERSEGSNYNQYAPSLQSLGITQSPVTANGVITSSSAPLPSQDRPDGSLDLTGIDDDEIDSYILTSKESEVKERFWMKLNGEHLKEMERRRKEREEEEEKEKDNPTKKKRRRVLPPRQNLASNTAIEAMEKIIHEKKLSNKVNYDILKEIEHTTSGMDSIKKERSQTVIENVNELVSTLGMDEAISDVSGPTSSRTVPLTPENMTRREREISRRNKPLKNSSALRVAFKIEPTTSTDMESQSLDVKRPISLNRSRYGRIGVIRPNLASAGVHKSVVNNDSAEESPVTVNEEEGQNPSKPTTLVPEAETSPDVKIKLQMGGVERSLNDEPESSSSGANNESITSSASNDDVPSPSLANNVENTKEVPIIPVVDGSNLLTRSKRTRGKIPKSAETLEQAKPAEEIASPSDEVQIMEDTTPPIEKPADSSTNLLRRGRRPMVKPQVQEKVHSPDSSGAEKQKDVITIDESVSGNDAAGTSTGVANSNLLKRGRRPLVKPAVASSNAKVVNLESSQKESLANESQESKEKSGPDEIVLQRGRKSLLKPKLATSSSELKNGETSKNNADSNANTNEGMTTDSQSSEMNVSSRTRRSSEAPLSPPNKKASLNSFDNSEPVTLTRPKPRSRPTRGALRR